MRNNTTSPSGAAQEPGHLFRAIEEDYKIIAELGLSSDGITDLTAEWRSRVDQEPARFITGDGSIDIDALRRFWRLMLFVVDAPSGSVGEWSLRNIFGGSHRGYRKWLRDSLETIKQQGFDDLLRKYPCPSIGNPHVFNYQGFRYTMRWIQHIYLVGLLRRVLKGRLSPGFVGLDIGSSFGVFSALVKNEWPDSHHVLVDFPEQLLLARYFLGMLFPRARIAGFEELKNEAHISGALIREYDFVLVPCQLYRRLDEGSVDLVANNASLGEMSRTWFDYYLQSDVFQTAKYFFTFNRVQSYPTYNSDLTILDYPIWDHGKRLHFAVSPFVSHRYKRHLLFFCRQYTAPPTFEYVGEI